MTCSVCALPAPIRAVITQRWLRGETFTDIGADVGVNRNTLALHIRRCETSASGLSARAEWGALIAVRTDLDRTAVAVAAKAAATGDTFGLRKTIERFVQDSAHREQFIHYLAVAEHRDLCDAIAALAAAVPPKDFAAILDRHPAAQRALHEDNDRD